jgi:hypothetical protein
MTGKLQKVSPLVLLVLLVLSMAYPSGIVTSSLSSTSVPYLNLSIQLANKLHKYMLDSSTRAYFNSLSSDWARVSLNQYSTLGNAFIADGMIQLYKSTKNATYLQWASSTSEQFWKHGWDSSSGGFYDSYDTSWSRTDCRQTLQNNAMFLIVSLNLYATNGTAVWLNRANTIESLMNTRFWDTTNNIAEASYDICAGKLSGEAHVEVSIGSYLWATAQWMRVTKDSSYLSRMNSAASFALNFLWDGPSNTLGGGANSIGCTAGGYLGFMRSAYADLSGLKDCRKGANENIWGAMGLAFLANETSDSTLKSWVIRDLAWINRTLWDKAYGGFHQNTFRDNTLRSACSRVNDPRDYPGWTEGEQPWFWWEIGQLLSNGTIRSWALVSEKWTATHQWNNTINNGGLMTCLNSNALPDAGSVYLYDWIQGSALYSFSTLASGTSGGSTTTATTPTSTTTRITTGGTTTLTVSTSLTTSATDTSITSKTRRLSIDGNALTKFSAQSGSISLSTANSLDLIILSVTMSDRGQVTSVSDSAGLSWSFRKSSVYCPYVRIEEWYAIAQSPLTGDMIKVKLNGAYNAVLIAFGVSGANSAAPFDPSMPVTGKGSSNTLTKSVSTSNANDFIFGLGGMVSASYFSSGPGLTLIQTGYSNSIGNQYKETGGAVYTVVSSPQVSSMISLLSPDSAQWAILVDAVSS